MAHQADIVCFDGADWIHKLAARDAIAPPS
jgi:hypothetical protein